MDIGEKAAVADLIKLAGGCGGIGPGDDAAAVDLGDRYLVMTTDMIAQHTHVPDVMTAKQVGWTVAAVNYSDVAAMGAEPLCFVVSMGFPRETDISYVKDVARGIKECSEMRGRRLCRGRHQGMSRRWFSRARPSALCARTAYCSVPGPGGATCWR